MIHATPLRRGLGSAHAVCTAKPSLLSALSPTTLCGLVGFFHLEICMYLITDSFGTRQTAWRWRTAMEWLRCCSDDARITHRVTGRCLARRVAAR